MLHNEPVKRHILGLVSLALLSLACNRPGFDPVALQDPDPGRRRRALWRMGESGVLSVPDIARGLQDSDSGVRLAAAELMAEAQAVMPSAAPSLREALSDPSPKVRKAAVRALAKLGESAEEQPPSTPGELARPPIPGELRELDKLRAWLESDEPRKKLSALRRLRLLKQAAAPLTRKIAEQLYDKSARVRAHAAATLGGIGGEGPVLVLAERLRDPAPGVREAALRALRSIGEPAREAGSLILRRLIDPKLGVREQAERALIELHLEPEHLPRIGEAAELAKIRAAYYRVLGARRPKKKLNKSP